MVNERLALLHTAFDPKSGQLAIRPPEGPPMLGDTRTEAGRAEIAGFLAAYLGEEARGTLASSRRRGTISPMSR
ncbi:hypothetical protein ACFQU2_16945 [Siccirubricoccus deserti]